MLDDIKDGIKNLGWGCLCAILELLLFICGWALLATVLSNWQIVLALIATLVFTLIIYFKYKMQIKKHAGTVLAGENSKTSSCEY